MSAILGKMKLHLITIGKPNLEYAKIGFSEYVKRLSKVHNVRFTHISDKNNNSEFILKTAGESYKIAMTIDSKQLNSHELANLLEKLSQTGKEVCYIIGGPDGLPKDVIDKTDLELSLSKLTFPHDLAMVVLAETIYRSSMINMNHPYHH